jgi:acetyl esterase/lipase
MPATRTINLWPDASSHNVPPPEGSAEPPVARTMPPGRPRVELFAPSAEAKPRTGPNKRACILVCPGGGYSRLTRHEGEPFCELFSSLGMVSGVVVSRIKPFQFPAPYMDACRAVRVIRSMADELDIDPNRIAIMGFSAGGHLAASVATRPEFYLDKDDDLAGKVSARPNRVILGYPAISLVTSYHTGCATNLLGPNSSEEQRREQSMELHVTKENPPAFIYHTSDDGAVLVENALMFASAYAREKVPCELHVYRSGPHGAGMALDRPALKSWTGLLVDWLSDWVKGE